MSRHSTIIIDGKRYRWRDILRMRQEQRASAAKASQLALFADLPTTAAPPMNAQLQAAISSRACSRRFIQSTGIPRTCPSHDI